MAINLNVTINKNGSMTVSWPAVAYAVKYFGHVELPKLGAMHYSNRNLTATSFTTDTGLREKMEYKVTVSAYNQKGGQVAVGTKYVTIPEGYFQAPLGVPQNVKATADTISVTVSYSAVSRASSYDVLFDNKVYNVTGTSKKITGLQPKTSHTYAVRAKNATQTGAYSSTQTIKTLAKSPAVPSNIRKTATETSATISWGAVSGANGYGLKFNGTVYSVTGTSRTFNGLTAGKAYPFSICSKSADANSAYTAQLTVTTPAKAPSNISATSTGDSVTVKWNAVTGVSGYMVKFDNIEYHIPASSTSYTFKNLKQKTSYSYQICCKSVDGKGTYSSSKSITTQPQTPSVPVGITKTATDDSATISWNAVKNATGYGIQFNGTTYSVTGASKTFTGLASNRSYRFKVCAKNGNVTGSYSSEMTVTTAPPAPVSINATATDNSVTVTWGAVSGAAGYTIFFGGKKYEVPSSPVSKTITGLASNTAYSYQICSRSVDGEGTYSSSKTVRTLLKMLPAPTGVSHRSTDDSVTLSWNAVSGAASYDVLFNKMLYRAYGTTKEIMGLTPNTAYSYQVRTKAADGGEGNYSAARTVRTAPEAPSSLKRSVNENSVTLSWDAVSGATSYDLLFDGRVYRVTGTSHTITGLPANQEYSYRLRVNNADGSSGYSNARTIGTAPLPPSSSTAAATSDSVTVTWAAVPGASSYSVLLGGKHYGTQATSCTIDGLAPATGYNYQVCSGNRYGFSSYGPLRTVSTLQAPPAVPADVNAESTENSVTLSWGAVPGATGYTVWLEAVGDKGAGYDVAATSETFTGLKPDTEYRYAVRANNAGGSSIFSKPQTIRTRRALPETPEFYAAVTDAHSIEYAWHAVPGADSYEILFGTTSYELAGLEKKFEGLEANTEYFCRIRARNETGASAYSTPLKVRTNLDVPQNIRAEAEVRAVEIRFDPVEGAAAYDIDFNGKIYRVTETSKRFGDLEPGTEYGYAVRAVNEYVSSLYSVRENVSTLLPGPAMPADVTATSTMSSVSVSWSPVEGAEDYDVMFDGMVSHVAGNGTTVRKMPVRRTTSRGLFGRRSNGISYFDLHQSTMHSYSVRSNNAEGSSPFTQEQYIMTKDRKSSGLAHGKRRRYPDGRRSYMGNDPVSALTGAFLWSYTWLEDHGKDGLHFTTMYDSRREARNREGGPAYPLGKKWTHSLDYLLCLDGEHAYFYTPYDDVAAFVRDGEDGSFRPADGETSSYALAVNGDGSYSVTDLDGTEYVFDEKLCLNRIVEDGMVSYRFLSDGDGQTVRMEGCHGAGMDLAYTDGKVTSVTDAMGNTVRFTYTDDRLEGVTVPDGGKMSFTYDDACNLLTITDFTGEVYLTNSYDEQGRVTEQVTAGRGKSSVSYDEENRVTEFTDELGHVTSYTHDEAGHVTDIVLEGSSIHTVYNDRGQMTEQTDALGNSTKMEYDEYGRMVRVIHPDGTEERAEYDGNNRPVKMTGQDGAAVSCRYDERGNLVWMQDERGNTSSYTYDEQDNLTSFTDRSGNVWTYAYDEQNHLERAADPDGNVCLYTHDAAGRMTSYTSPGGRTVSCQYSAAGDLLSVEDADGRILFTYDRNGNRTGTTDRMGNGQRLEYNAMGQVTLATDFLGNEYRFAYDEKGNLVTETDPLGYCVSSTYDAHGNRTSRTDQNGGVTDYSFDAAGQLVRVCDAAGGTVSYTYDCMGRVSAVTDQLSNRRSYVYDAAGRVLSETNPLGHSVGYTYDEAGNLLARTDEDGNVISYTYDAENRLQSVQTGAGATVFAYDRLGRVVSVTDTEGNTEHAQYDADDNLTAAADRDGRETVYAYDGMGRLLEETAPDGGKTAYAYDKNGNRVRVTDAEGHVTAYEYDANNRLVKETDPLGHETAYVYDARGQLAEVTDANGGVTAYAYDGNGNLVSETNPLGGERTYVYDSLDRLTGSTDEEGNTWGCTYDAAGNRTSFTDANGNVRTYEYDANNRLTCMRDGGEGSLMFEYTNTGRVSRVTDMEGAVTDYEYDALGRLVRVSGALGSGAAFTYDGTGRMTSRTDANGNTTRYAYSPAGNLLSVTDGEGNATAYTYDALGRVLTETDALGGTVSYARDLLGQVTSMTDAMGNTTSFTYTADGRIATVENAEGGVTRYSYDACGNLVRTEDALGHAAQYEYDAAGNRIKECLSGDGEQSCITLYLYDRKGRVVRETNPLLEEKAYAYDGNDNVVSVTDEEQRETVITYDLNNNPLSMAYSDGRTAAFRYNRRGEPVEMTDWNGTTSMERDALGRLAAVTDHNGRRTGFSHDAAGNRTGIRYPDGSVAAYAFDKNNRLLSVKERAAEASGTADAAGDAGQEWETIAQYAYDAAGNVASVTQPGSVASYAYNASRQPVKASYLFGGTASVEEAFTYDAAGRITGSVRGGNMPGAARSAAYGYDAAGQLVSYREGGKTEAYAYDALGNRTSKTLDGVQKAVYEYNALNQLVSMTEDGVVYGFGYDRCGNLTEERRGESVVRQYAYDAAGRMVLGKNPEAGEESGYSYNALGMCVGNVRKTVVEGGPRNREVQYVPDYLGNPCSGLAAYETGAGSIRTVFGQGYHRLSQSAAGGRTFFQSDIYGSPLFAADGQGMVLQYAGRGIWGNLKDGTEILPEFVENMGFTSYRYDPVTGKHFAHARFYDDANGRMLAPDPVRRDLNGYRYCGNDPVDYVDPTGEIGILGRTVIGGALGAVIGGAGGFISSAVSQKLGGGKVDWKKARGEAVKGAITGAVQGGMVASGVKIPKAAANAANFLAGTIGSAAEQKIARGRVSAGRSILGGIANMAGNSKYGTGKLDDWKDAAVRGMKAGGLNAGLGYLADVVDPAPRLDAAGAAGFAAGIAGSFLQPFGMAHDPRRGCGSLSPFNTILGHTMAKGYRYGVSQTGFGNRKKPSLMGFLGEGLRGVVTGGVSSVAFYGLGKGIDKLWNGFRAGRGSEVTNTEVTSYYPLNDGALSGTKQNMYLMSGEVIDRYGSLKGKYFSPNGTPLEMRALPYNADLTQYRKFEVVKPFEVESSIIAPAFGKIGLGIQYRSAISANVLLKRGIIKVLGEN